MRRRDLRRAVKGDLLAGVLKRGAGQFRVPSTRSRVRVVDADRAYGGPGSVIPPQWAYLMHHNTTYEPSRPRPERAVGARAACRVPLLNDAAMSDGKDASGRRFVAEAVNWINK